MDEIVHGHEPTTGCCEVFVAVPAVDEHGGVVIPVQEDELLLSQHNEHGVDELWQLAQHEHQRPEAGDAVGITVVANTVDDTVLGQRPNEIRPDTNSADDAEHGQDDVPDDEETPQLELGTILHVPFAGEDEKHVEEGGRDAHVPVVSHPLSPRVGVLLVVEERLIAECVLVGLVVVQLSIDRLDVEHRCGVEGED